MLGEMEDGGEVVRVGLTYVSPVLKTKGWEPSSGQRDLSLNWVVSQTICWRNVLIFSSPLMLLIWKEELVDCKPQTSTAVTSQDASTDKHHHQYQKLPAP